MPTPSHNRLISVSRHIYNKYKYICTLIALFVCAQRWRVSLNNSLAQPKSAIPIFFHYSDVIMGAMASQITSALSVYSIVCSGVDQRKHQSSPSLTYVRGIHWWPVAGEFPSQRASKMFPFHDVFIVAPQPRGSHVEATLSDIGKYINPPVSL